MLWDVKGITNFCKFEKPLNIFIDRSISCVLGSIALIISWEKPPLFDLENPPFPLVFWVAAPAVLVEQSDPKMSGSQRDQQTARMTPAISALRCDHTTHHVHCFRTIMSRCDSSRDFFVKDKSCGFFRSFHAAR